MKTKEELNAIREAQKRNAWIENVKRVKVYSQEEAEAAWTKIFAPQQPQAEDDDRRGWPEHEEPIPNNKPTSWNFEIKETAMTQSDAPNELNKEQFFKLIGAHPHHANATVIWDTLDLHGYTILKKMTNAPNEGREEKIILYGTYDQVLQSLHEVHDELDQHKQIIRKRNNEITELRDQLSIEKEFRGNLLKDISNLSDQLSKEREMRKELVGYVIAYRGLASLTSDEDIFIGSLIKKASELDKNKG